MFKNLFGKPKPNSEAREFSSKENAAAPNLIAIQEAFITELLYDFKEEWDSIHLHFELYCWKNSKIKKYILKYYYKKQIN